MSIVGRAARFVPFSSLDRPPGRGFPAVSLRLWGGYLLSVDESPLQLCRREQKVLALVALWGAVDRGRLASTIWPESTDGRATGNLRAALFALHRRLPGAVESDRFEVRLTDRVRTDADVVAAALACVTAPEMKGAAKELLPALAVLEVAVAADLLPDWYDDWVLRHREELRGQVAAVALTAAQQALQRGDLEVAEAAARVAASADQLDERAHELLITSLVQQGRRVDGRRLFLAYVDRLRYELGVGPSDRMVRLLESG